MNIKVPFFKKIFLTCKNLFLKYRLLVFLLVVLVLLAYLAIIFYLFALNVQPGSPPTDKKLSVNPELYKKLIDNFNQRELLSQQEETKTYLDPFK